MMILDKVAEIIVETAGCKVEEVVPEAELSVLGVDSLKAITVLFELEEAFDIEIPNEVIPSIVTVNDILEKIAEIRQ
ncbi:MAG TPA: acyl carrier protein [Gammaproteobacteria bacterium]|nr:acyl carrier protein [Gammaproteobacteria bacterium]